MTNDVTGSPIGSSQRLPPPEAEAPVRRIVLLGSGASGSTLLAMHLALSPEVTALGEVSEFRRIEPGVHECTCGVVFGDCPLWGDLLREAGETGLGTADFLRRAFARAGELESTPWSVDSVKSKAALTAERELGVAGARWLYLVRHPGGYVYSQLNCGLELDQALGAWIDEQQKTLAFLEETGVEAFTVRYEDLAEKTAETLGDLGCFIGVTGPGGETSGPWDWQSAPWGRRQHVLCGAGWRLGGRPAEVKEDVRWKLALRPSAQAKIVAACRTLLDRFGYDPTIF